VGVDIIGQPEEIKNGKRKRMMLLLLKQLELFSNRQQSEQQL
jgi:hypothetical protein